MYENAELCERCAGKCCKEMPGEMSPEDTMRLFPSGDLETAVHAAIESGLYVFDYWCGDPRGLDYDDPDYMRDCYYMRPRAINDDPRDIKCGSWGGMCILLGENGCTLNPDMRPISCRMLEPKQDGSCVMHDGGGKRVAALLWMPHQEIARDTIRKWYQE